MTRRPHANVLVGRADELMLLERLAGRAAAGRGSVVLVTGEPGVGKSRLLAETAVRASAAGLTTAAGRAVEGTGGAYRPIVDALLGLQRRDLLPAPASLGIFGDALAGLVPGWAPLARPLSDADTDLSLLVSEALLRLLNRLGQGHGALMALDDLHWADADSLAALDRLADVVTSEPVLLVLATRPNPPPALARLVGRGHEHLALQRLPPDAAGQMLDACSDGVPLPDPVREHVLGRAEGLPFMVEELFAGLIHGGAVRRTSDGWAAQEPLGVPVPASFAAVVQERLSSLPGPAREVVRAAAVLGERTDLASLASVTRLPREAIGQSLRSAVACDLLVCDGAHPNDVRFAHALTRDTVLEQLLPFEHTELLGRAAPVVEASGDPVAAARLYARAGQRPHAARLLLSAATGDASPPSWREELLRRAAALAPEDHDVATALVEVLAAAGKAALAREAGDALLTLLPSDDARRPRVALALARACHLTAQHEQAMRYLEMCGTGPAAHALAAHVQFARQRPADAERLANTAAGSDDPAVRCEALEVVGRVARLRNRPNQARTAFTAALELARRHRLPVWEVRALHELGTLDLLGPATTGRLEAARELALRTGVLATAAVLDVQITAVHGLRMDHPATLTTAARGIELCESLRLHTLTGALQVFVATAQGHTGLVAEMHRTLDEAEKRLRQDPDKLAAVHFARGTPAMAAHDLETWRSSLQHGMAVLRTNPSASPAPHRGLHALLETVLGDGAAEREELRSSGATVQACNRGALAYADAVADARAGRDPQAHLRAAERAMAPLTWRHHHLRLLVAPTALAGRWGSPLEWLREAADHFAGAQCPALARACRDQLRAAGAPVPRAGRGDARVPPQLRGRGITSREMDVLELVAQGLSNRAVAQRLVLSSRTVETHVASLLAKTGAPGRGHLHRWLEPPDPSSYLRNGRG